MTHRRYRIARNFPEAFSVRTAVPGYLPVRRMAFAPSFDPSFHIAVRWFAAVLLGLGLMAGQTSVATAHGASVSFNGYVPARKAGSLYIESDRLVAFGAMAGIRLHAVNSTAAESRLSYVVFDDASNAVAGGEDWGHLVPPGDRITTIVVFPLGNESTQRFRLCARQQQGLEKTSPSKCFPVVVTRVN